MEQNPRSALGDGRPLRLLMKNGECFAYDEALGLSGRGQSISDAIAALNTQYQQLRAFADDSGIPLSTFGTATTQRQKTIVSSLARLALVIGAFGLMMVPLSYALSGALERTVLNLNLKGGHAFWSNAEAALIRAADPAGDLPPEQVAKIVDSLRRLVHRIKPFTDEMKPLAGCPAEASRP